MKKKEKKRQWSIKKKKVQNKTKTKTEATTDSFQDKGGRRANDFPEDPPHKRENKQQQNLYKNRVLLLLPPVLMPVAQPEVNNKSVVEYDVTGEANTKWMRWGEGRGGGSRAVEEENIKVPERYANYSNYAA